MAVVEKDVLIRCKDAEGNTYLLYPITRLDCVDGAEDLLHFGEAQELTDEEQTQARTNIGAADKKSLTELAVRVLSVESELDSLCYSLGDIGTMVSTEKKATVKGETLIL